MKDINNDGVIDDVNDRTFIGDPTPNFNLGITNNFNYKNFDLNISYGRPVGGEILNAAKWAYQTNMDGSSLLLAAALIVGDQLKIRVLVFIQELKPEQPLLVAR